MGGSTPITVTVDAADSLTDVATKINASDARVSASVIYDGTNHRLMIMGKDTGSTNQVTYKETGTVALGSTSATPTKTPKMPRSRSTTSLRSRGAQSVFRCHSRRDDHRNGSSDTKLEIAPDSTEQAAKVNEFINATIRRFRRLNLRPAMARRRHPTRTWLATARFSATDSSRVPFNSIPGLTGKYNMLASVGVKLSSSGALELDQTKLKTALEEDPDAVAKVFIGDSSNSVDGAMKIIADVVKVVADDSDSILNSRKKSFESQIERLEEQGLLSNVD